MEFFFARANCSDAAGWRLGREMNHKIEVGWDDGIFEIDQRHNPDVASRCLSVIDDVGTKLKFEVSLPALPNDQAGFNGNISAILVRQYLLLP
jgi:hypothetical protein